ncbi:molybdenum cofactor guanylyltransferase MobA [Brucella sp. BE17]|uniref:molybdenum cofactor guanylyltransferase MobA n=1 Tax=Brucella sp. BE17 TaxID=3142977 RepID=UPI0031BA3A71
MLNKDFAGAIIAGGRSSRMQNNGIAGDKFLQPLGSSPVIAHVAKRLKPQVNRLFINANGNPARLAALDLSIVADNYNRHGGPLPGILTALNEARGFPWLVTAAADTPFLPHDLVTRLIQHQLKTGFDIVLASSADRVHPLFGLWRTSLVPRLKDWLSTCDKASVLAFACFNGFEAVDFPFQTTQDGSEHYDPFFNINRPEDLVTARRLNGVIA